MAHDLKIETFAKIHKWICEQDDIEQWERIGIMSHIADNYLQSSFDKKN